jgi:uncharacterized membrane protein
VRWGEVGANRPGHRGRVKAMTGFVMNMTAAVVFGLVTGSWLVAVVFAVVALVCLLGRESK